MLDPHTASVLSLDEIWAMTDELIEAHGKALPKLTTRPQALAGDGGKAKPAAKKSAKKAAPKKSARKPAKKAKRR